MVRSQGMSESTRRFWIRATHAIRLNREIGPGESGFADATENRSIDYRA